MRKPDFVIEYDKAFTAYQRGEVSKPKMFPQIVEWKQYSGLFYRLRDALTHKDRTVRTRDIEALTEEMKWHIGNTHGKNNSVVFFAKKESDFLTDVVYRAQVSSPVSALSAYKLDKLMTIGKKVNLYISSLDFINGCNNRRTYDLAYSAHAIQVDIDYYTDPKLKAESAETVYREICKYLKKKYKGKLLPSYGINSGNGLYLIFLTDELILYNNEENKMLYNNLMFKLISDLSPFHADMSCKDLSRVLRIPSTFNLKNGGKKLAYIIDFDNIKNKPVPRYSIKTLKSVLKVNNGKKESRSIKPTAPSKTLKLKQKTKQNTVKKNSLTLNSLGKARVTDLIRYLRNRHFNIEKRHLFFLYLGVSCAEYNTPLDLHIFLQDINKQIKEPLPDREIDRIYKTVLENALFRNGLDVTEMKHYTDYNDYLPENPLSDTYKQDKLVFSNNVIINELEMTESEVKTNKTIITKEEKNERQKAANKRKRRNSNGLTKKQQEIQDKLFAMQKMLQHNENKEDIMKALKISRRTYYLYYSRISAA